ncbi:hypothetical protein NLJ89_g9145 [Agrocybe chaxingu]|uniref:Proteinase n=1 Tax=Agrocybe chaxingu TaxID=84603 RepID=A0A9W8MS41_9AGAR|nr:hypothetical protein NLJ89_g9145 [Agrocybe chaxingu]
MSHLSFLRVTLSVGLLAFSLIHFPSAGAQTAFDWNSITPSTSLNWVSCYSQLTQCARLNVPLDYSNPSAGSAAIALIRIPSPLGLSGSPAYRGPILFNPGGPGESGVNAGLALGSAIQGVFGQAFDLVSFDPRGIGHSTPSISIFTSDVERAAFDLGAQSLNTEVTSSSTLPERWAKIQVLGSLARDRSANVISHMTTDNVARDMLRIIEAHGRDKLQYWGISYGSVLGATFAALFPDKVERLIIDGVLDLQRYYSVDGRNHVVDADKALQAFFDACVAAGSQACAFHSPSAGAIKRRLDRIYERVLRQPVPAYSPSFPKYGVVDFVTLKNTILTALYTPSASFAPLARGLKALEDGDASVLYQLPRLSSDEVFASIMCSDGNAVTDSAAQVAKYAETISRLSTFSSLISSIRLLCSGWKIHPNSFKGPLSGNTSFPLLIIGNTADPVTSLSMAKKASRAFPGSVVLTYDIPGHTSFAWTSLCVIGHVRAYFQNGALPTKGAICNDAVVPYFTSTSTTNATGLVNERRDSLDEIVEVLRRADKRELFNAF